MIHLNKKILVSFLVLGMVLGPVEAKVPSHGARFDSMAHRRHLREKRLKESTFSLKDVPTAYVPAISDNQPLTMLGYKADMMSVLRAAREAHKKYFEFDGTRYRTDEKDAQEQISALLKARWFGQTTYKHRGKEYPACSGYADAEQLDVFGNIWEELRSPQSPETKAILRLCARNLVGSRDKALANSSLTRLYEICRFGGYPEVKDGNKTSSLMDGVIRMANGHNISHYEPPILGGEIHIPLEEGSWKEKNTDDVIGELAHAVRQNMHVFGESFYLISDGIKDLVTGKNTGWNGTGYLQNYNKLDHMEHDAHTIVENVLKAYIFGETFNGIPSPSSLNGVFATIQAIRREFQKNGGSSYMLTPSTRKRAKLGLKDIYGETEIIYGIRRKVLETPEK